MKRHEFIEPQTADCLVIVDLQNDFMPGGALPVPGGDEIVAPINDLAARFPLVIATQDWHPEEHCSFAESGGMWPPHCVQRTWGAKLHAKFDMNRIHLIVLKGQHQDHDAYSGFQETTLKEDLLEHGIKRVFICGLATDYCVKQTAFDALKNRFQVFVLTDLVRAVNLNPGDGERALAEMQAKGAALIDTGVFYGKIAN